MDKFALHVGHWILFAVGALVVLGCFTLITWTIDRLVSRLGQIRLFVSYSLRHHQFASAMCVHGICFWSYRRFWESEKARQEGFEQRERERLRWEKERVDGFEEQEEEQEN